MAVKMRLIRMGKKRSSYYRVVVMDGRAPRDGRYIEQIGVYDPNQRPSLVEIDNDRAVEWMSKGAQPTEPVRKLLEISGALSKFKVAAGKIHTITGSPRPEPEPIVAVETEETGDAEVTQEPVAAEAAIVEDAMEEPSADDSTEEE